MNITIINAYGKKNLGDSAILHSAINILDEMEISPSQVNVLCEDVKDFPSFKSKHIIKPLQLPYGYAIKSKSGKATSSFAKFFKFFYILFKSIMCLIFDLFLTDSLPQKGFFTYIRSIKEANYVVSMGGGYFITKYKLTDYFGLILCLLPIFIAKRYRKNIIFLPISFGPFASDFQKKITFLAIKSYPVFCRENISKRILNNMSKNNIASYSPDLAFYNKFTNKTSPLTKFKSKYIVLSAREWLAPNKQKEYEKKLSELVDIIWTRYKIKTIFVLMANNPSEEFDLNVAKRIQDKVKNLNSFSIFKPSSFEDVQKLLNESFLTVCTRMHVSILASTVNTPFILIGYGHKSKGIVELMDLNDWILDINDLRLQKIMDRFEKLCNFKDYQTFINKINKYNKLIIKDNDNLKNALYKFLKT